MQFLIVFLPIIMSIILFVLSRLIIPDITIEATFLLCVLLPLSLMEILRFAKLKWTQVDASIYSVLVLFSSTITFTLLIYASN